MGPCRTLYRKGGPRRVFGDDDVKEYWCSVETSECGRFAVLYKWDFVHANVVYLLRLSDDAFVPVAPEMRSVNQVQVIDNSLLIRTDLDAPRGRLCVAPLTAPTECAGRSTSHRVSSASKPLADVCCRRARHGTTRPRAASTGSVRRRPRSARSNRPHESRRHAPAAT